MKPERVAQEAAEAQPKAEIAIGEALADRRRALGMSMDDIALQLKFHVRQIEALEQGRFEKLSGPTFVRGMVRAYARLVRMDPEPLLQGLAVHGHAPEDQRVAVSLRKPIPFSDDNRRVNLVYVVLSLLTIAAIGVLAVEWPGERAANARLVFVRPAEAPLEPVRAPVQVAANALAAMKLPGTLQQGSPALAESVARPADGRHRIALSFESESWVQIRGGDGRILLSQLNPAGTERIVEGEPPFALVIGNAPGVRLRYDDLPVDLAPHIRVEVARLTLQ